jgi:NADH dehydrogenase
MPNQIVTVFGGSGFLGRYIVRRLAREGLRVRVAVRRPNEALFLRPYGAVGQIELVQANVKDDASVAAAVQGASAVINATAIRFGDSASLHRAVQQEGAGRVAAAAKAAGAARLVHISAIGADPGAASIYAETKGKGEKAVTEAFPNAVILRPSALFGTEDGFFNKIAGLVRLLPVYPLFGAETRFQPVWADDVAAAAVKAATGEVKAGVFELGGPEVMSQGDVVALVMAATSRRRPVLALPLWLASIKAWFLDAAQFLTGGIVRNSLITRDQVRLLGRDSVVGEGASGLEAFGITPAAPSAMVPGYLTRFRPHGQYHSLTNSARNLRP